MDEYSWENDVSSEAAHSLGMDSRHTSTSSFGGALP
ncbi:hypothetical protein LINPERPRIM_LOCUS13147 [Linum perenne]